MRKTVFSILIILALFAGCRCHKRVVETDRAAATEISGVTLRTLDSLWNSHTELQTLKITYYRPNDYRYQEGLAQNPTDTAQNVGKATSGGFGGVAVGPIQSIEITTQATDESKAWNVSDSSSVDISSSASEHGYLKETEHKTDWGAVAFVLVLCVLVIAILVLIIRIIK